MKAPANLRNGLKWRDGRPRWEPSPAARALGIKGRDLRTATGEWMPRGPAIGAADARHLWARLLREAYVVGAAGDEARTDLREALDALPAASAAVDRHARELVSDLIEAARAFFSGLDAEAGVRLIGGPRTVDAMIDGYFADSSIRIADATRTLYLLQAKRIRAKLGRRRIDEVTRGELRTWYVELKDETSASTANVLMGALGSFYRWAGWQDWITDSPVRQLGMEAPEGRRVYWTLQEEQTFVPWCDANGFADIGDGVTACLWTGARIGDMCAATLQDLAGETWRYVPEKTKRRGQEALPGLLPVVKARVKRASESTVKTLDRAFLVTPSGQAHTARSFGPRFRDARGRAVAAGAVPASFAEKRVADTRDTCITRLADAAVPFMRIWPWTGHSPRDCEDILRDHYIVLRQEGAMQTARALEAWAELNKVALNG